MINHHQTDEEKIEWKIAKDILATKSAYKKSQGFKIRRKSNPELSHSFLYIGGKLVRLDVKLYLGHGQYGKVKVAETEDGQQFALKIEAAKYDLRTFIKQVEKEIEEEKKIYTSPYKPTEPFKIDAENKTYNSPFKIAAAVARYKPPKSPESHIKNRVKKLEKVITQYDDKYYIAAEVARHNLRYKKQLETEREIKQKLGRFFGSTRRAREKYTEDRVLKKSIKNKQYSLERLEPGENLALSVFNNVIAGNLNILEKIVLLKNATSDIKILHDLGVLHCDIKPNNFVASIRENYTVRAVDISANILQPNEDYLKIKGPDGRAKIMGTSGYLAPEIILAGKYSKASDVFALGIVLLDVIFLLKDPRILNKADTYLHERYEDFVKKQKTRTASSLFNSGVVQEYFRLLEEETGEKLTDHHILKQLFNLILKMTSEYAFERPTVDEVLARLNELMPEQVLSSDKLIFSAVPEEQAQEKFLRDCNIFLLAELDERIIQEWLDTSPKEAMEKAIILDNNGNVLYIENGARKFTYAADPDIIKNIIATHEETPQLIPKTEKTLKLLDTTFEFTKVKNPGIIEDLEVFTIAKFIEQDLGEYISALKRENVRNALIIDLTGRVHEIYDYNYISPAKESIVLSKKQASSIEPYYNRLICHRKDFRIAKILSAIQDKLDFSHLINSLDL